MQVIGRRRPLLFIKTGEESPDSTEQEVLPGIAIEGSHGQYAMGKDSATENIPPKHFV